MGRIVQRLEKTAAALAALAMVCAGIPAASYADSAQDTEETSQTVPVYRLYSRYNGEHFYTTNHAERAGLIHLGWIYEGIGWVAPADGTPVYRLYNPNESNHHYTLSTTERDYLTSIGWNDEGVGWYSGGDLDVTRQYNPNAEQGAHNFTLSTTERDYLTSIGWNDEGIAWHAVANTREATRAGDVEKMIEWAEGIAEDDTHGYSQKSRLGTPDYDCSSLVYYSLVNGGFDMDDIEGEIFYTGNEAIFLKEAGWVRVGGSELTPETGLQRGDILLAHNNKRQHTEIYLGDGQDVGAHGNYDGVTGDSSGREISVAAWGDFYTDVYRWEG